MLWDASFIVQAEIIDRNASVYCYRIFRMSSKLRAGVCRFVAGSFGLMSVGQIGGGMRCYEDGRTVAGLLIWLVRPFPASVLLGLRVRIIDKIIRSLFVIR